MNNYQNDNIFDQFKEWHKLKSKNGSIIWTLYWNNPSFPCITNGIKHWDFANIEKSEYCEQHLLYFYRDLSLGYKEKIVLEKKFDGGIIIKTYINSDKFFYTDWDLISFDNAEKLCSL